MDNPTPKRTLRQNALQVVIIHKPALSEHNSTINPIYVAIPKPTKTNSKTVLTQANMTKSFSKSCPNNPEHPSTIYPTAPKRKRKNQKTYTFFHPHQTCDKNPTVPTSCRQRPSCKCESIARAFSASPPPRPPPKNDCELWGSHSQKIRAAKISRYTIQTFPPPRPQTLLDNKHAHA